ncbi:hypothetical protein MTR_2g084455 [Medicago truncatula]|uniref:Uncharacterized protein n=1 Tax=Medicago truncatula TaxID=3880 RepID=A0A072VBD9_MEDTR|nr:hypothetical protein MTR_2g084455 [Medicago truncatula]
MHFPSTILALKGAKSLSKGQNPWQTGHLGGKKRGADGLAKALIANTLPGATPLAEKRGAEPLANRATFSLAEPLAWSVTFVCRLHL